MPWFDAGLRFECTACGDCCRREGDVYFTRAEADEAARYSWGPDATVEAMLGEVWVEDFDGRYRVAVPFGGACPFLTPERRCAIHPVKPAQCRTYPFWSDVVRSERTWLAEQPFCEGIGRGEIVTAERIVAAVRESDT